MTLGEANELFESWDYAPPTNMLLDAIVRAFGGGGTESSNSTQSRAAQTGGSTEGPTNAQLFELSVKAGNSLPILKGKDVGLPATPPVFDFEELRARNTATVVRATLKERGIGQRA
jgi:hypothetical protein